MTNPKPVKLKKSSKKSSAKVRTATKHSRWFMRALMLLILVVLLAAVLLTARIQSVRARQAAKTPKVNDYIAVMQLKWQDNTPTIPQMYQPPRDYKIIRVTVQLLNLQSKTVWLAPAIESYVIDSNNTRYGMALAQVNHAFVSGEYAPQQAATGDLTYAVPKQASRLDWCYKLDSVNTEPICVALNQYSLAK